MTFMLSVIMLSVIMLSVTYKPFILSVIMLNVVLSSVVVPISGRIKTLYFFVAYEWTH
jgi:uncharacterized membrane protein YraQ (UPF0718 family)